MDFGGIINQIFLKDEQRIQPVYQRKPLCFTLSMYIFIKTFSTGFA